MTAAAPAATLTLRALPEALEEAAYVHERFACVMDPAMLATRFLKYQTGPFVSFDQPVPVPKEKLNRALVAAMKHGRTLTLAFKSLEDAKQDNIFEVNFSSLSFL